MLLQLCRPSENVLRGSLRRECDFLRGFILGGSGP